MHIGGQDNILLRLWIENFGSDHERADLVQRIEAEEIAERNITRSLEIKKALRPSRVTYEDGIEDSPSGRLNNVIIKHYNEDYGILHPRWCINNAGKGYKRCTSIKDCNTNDNKKDTKIKYDICDVIDPIQKTQKTQRRITIQTP